MRRSWILTGALAALACASTQPEPAGTPASSASLTASQADATPGRAVPSPDVAPGASPGATAGQATAGQATAGQATAGQATAGPSTKTPAASAVSFVALSSVRPPVKPAAELHFDAVAGDTPSVSLRDGALARGRKAMAQKDLDTAIAAYEEALSHDGLSAVARAELGYAILQSSHDGSATDLLRSAEALATDPAVAAAIAHNLVKSHLDANDTELADRAKRRAALLRGVVPAGVPTGATTGPTNGAAPQYSTCPARVVPSREIERTNWLGAYARIVGERAEAWGLTAPAQTQAQARSASCWRSSGSVEDPPTRSTECEGQVPWEVTTEHVAAYADTTHFVWPLGATDVALFSTLLGGSVCSMEQDSTHSAGHGQRVDDFLVLLLTEDQFGWVPATSQCLMMSTRHDVELYDLSLGRGFRIEGLGADVTLGLVPSRHSITLTGATCDDYVDLATIR